MAPAQQPRPTQHYEVGERVLCYHGPVMYEAKVLDVGRKDADNKRSDFRYFVHYLGWKGTWDDWVDDERLRKATAENRDFMKQQHQSQKAKQRIEADAKKAAKRQSLGGPAAGQPSSSSRRKGPGGGDPPSSVRGSEERGSSVLAAPPPRGTKRNRDWDLEKEQDFFDRPSVRIPLPDSLKRLLVDDWEFVTKDMALVPLPHRHPVSEILDDYVRHEAPRRREGSAEADVLEEVVQGVRDYFDRSLGRILLYRFERQQWFELSTCMNKDPSDPAAVKTTVAPRAGGGNAVGADGAERDGAAGEGDLTFQTNVAGKAPAEVYGAEHLARLFVSLPELVAQTNMDAPSVHRLREELAALTRWLGRNAAHYFSPAYAPAAATYKANAEGTK